MDSTWMPTWARPFNLLPSLVLSASCLAGCGGGGAPNGGASGPIAQISVPTFTLPQAQPDFDGGWVGPYGAATSETSATEFIAVTSANWGFLAVYGDNVDTNFRARGLLVGSGFNPSSPIRYEAYDPERSEATAKLDLDPSGPTISGVFSEASQQKGVVGGAFAAPGFRSDVPASAIAIAGHWDLTTSRGRAISMDVGEDGTITGTSGSCTIYGSKIKPTNTGTAVYSVALRFRDGASGCSEPHGLSDGVFGFAIIFSSKDGSNQLALAAQNGWDPVFLAAAGKR